MRTLLVLGVLSLMQPSMTLQSPAFKHNASWPVEYTGYGDFKSPPLRWSGVPKAAKELALILEDPDVPVERFSVHWLLYNIPITTTAIPETGRGSQPMERDSPVKGASQGLHAMKRQGYLPPRPFANSGVHRYTFTLYALDADLPLADGLTKDQLMAAIKGHVIAQAMLVGVFERREP